MHPDQPAVSGQGASPAAVAGPDAPLHSPGVTQRMPDDAPLVLRLRVSRLLAFFGTCYLGVPALVLAIFLGWVASNVPPDRSSRVLPPIIIYGVVLVFLLGGLQLFVVITAAMGKGPQLAADQHGVWVQSRRWRTRSAFLPWDAVDRIFVRRNRRVFWLLVCVRTVVPPPDHGLRAGLDARTQRMLFGTTFNASPFLCGRRAGDVVADLSRLADGRVRIG
jgi:hypothetical protein